MYKRQTLSSRRDVDMSREFKFRHSGETYKCCPIIASNMDGVGTFSIAIVLQNYKMMTTITKTTTLGEWQQAVGNGIKLKYLSVCSGTNKLWTDEAEDYITMQKVLKSFPDVKFITIDVANGYHTNFSDFIARVRDEYPDKTIIAGNVVTAEMTEELIIRGADVVKVGIGPGSVCTTRTMAGVGVPQFSAVMECADAANGVGGHIVADGGCTMPGDLAKAFGAMKTPHVYLFDANDKLVYTGAIDDNAKSAKRVKKNYLMDALSSLGSGKNIATRKTKALGCSIKFN